MSSFLHKLWEQFSNVTSSPNFKDMNLMFPFLSSQILDHQGPFFFISGHSNLFC